MKKAGIILLLPWLLGSVNFQARANDAAVYPSRKIRLLLPFAAGSGGDVMARLLADRMANRLGQIIYVENRPGAGGTIGMQQVATSVPDGYTITIGGMTTNIIAPAVYANLSYDPARDFATIGRIGISAVALVAAPDFPAKDLRGLIDEAKKHAPVLYGSWGTGSTGHFCGEVLANRAGIQLQHVPFSGMSKLANDLLGSHIKAGLMDVATATPLVKDGSLKALATCGGRSPSLVGVGSYSDQGIDFERTFSWIMFAPAATPREIIKQLEDTLRAVLDETDIQEKLLTVGITASFVPGQAQQQTDVEDIEAWKKIASETKIKIQ